MSLVPLEAVAQAVMVAETCYAIGHVKEVTPLSIGLVNNNFLITAGTGRYVLQQLGAAFTSPQVVIDQLAVCQVMHAADVLVPVLIAARDGRPFVVHEGRIWKLSVYLAHDHLSKHDAAVEAKMSAATLLGKFHVALGHVNYMPRFRLPGFHDVAHVARKLRAALAEEKEQSARGDVLMLGSELVERLGDSCLSYKGTLQLIHADPKFDNFIFRGGTAVGIIDMDTLMVARVTIDVGDFMRSFLQGKEDAMQQDLFDPLYHSYRAGFGSRISFAKRDARIATKTIYTELAARFLTDCVDDSYFNWDKEKFPSRFAHNLHRAKHYARLAEEM